MREIVLDGVPGNKETAIVTSWQIEEGDEVEEGELLIEMESAGKSVYVKAPAKGILQEKYVEKGDEIEVGEAIAAFEDMEYSTLEEFDI